MWLRTSASAGSSRNVFANNWDMRWTGTFAMVPLLLLPGVPPLERSREWGKVMAGGYPGGARGWKSVIPGAAAEGRP
ncbi:hypothetical protein GCM10017668_51720 [Streptomyces tuirus]|uniref:Uncharacterized protein n=1 Tax=Streptomyces tuirus TaxID=68278 RepID=A0A7G1NKK9_9ACTN|nr:hypothetical protein GCM10017668_51720 [Streptomyces tuirus]